ncbi:MAG: histidine kinase [Pseudomonadota bacterium]
MTTLRKEPRELLSGLNIAAYITWLTVLVLLLDAPPHNLARTRAEAFACMTGFLAVFVFKQLRGASGRENAGLWMLLALEGVLALLTCLFWSPASVSPILTIIFVADCAFVLGAVRLAVVAIVLNVGLWFIAAEVWDLRAAWRLLVAYGGFQLFAMVTAMYARRAENTADQLRQTNAHLLATRSLLEESARDHERLHLARELHDVAGHKLTALKLNLTALQREANAPNVDTAAQLATELLADIRGVVAQIRQHDGLDVRAALTQLIAPFPAPPRIHLLMNDDARVACVAHAETLLRVVQEALTNAIRHADARNVWIELSRAGAQIHLRVRDDGHVELPLEEGFGLTGMRERLAQISARLEISRAAQGGVALDVQLPLQA